MSFLVVVMVLVFRQGVPSWRCERRDGFHQLRWAFVSLIFRDFERLRRLWRLSDLM